MSLSAIPSLRAELGECPLWNPDSNKLDYVDLLHGSIIEVQRDGCSTSRPVEGPLTSIGLRARADEWVGTTAETAGLVSSTGFAKGARLPIVPDTRLNDGACDSRGRLWVGSMAGKKDGLGALFLVDLDWTVHVKAVGFNLCNGIDWSPDDRYMYLIDSRPGVVWRWNFENDSGTLSNKTLLIRRPGSGIPDGMTVDAEGNLWVAFVGAGAIRSFTPDGTFVSEYTLPVSQPTSVAFGGEHLDDLYVTTATVGLSPEALLAQPQAGLVFHQHVGSTGQSPKRSKHENPDSKATSLRHVNS